MRVSKLISEHEELVENLQAEIERLQAEKAEAIDVAKFYAKMDRTVVEYDCGQKAHDLLKKWGVDV